MKTCFARIFSQAPLAWSRKPDSMKPTTTSSSVSKISDSMWKRERVGSPSCHEVTGRPIAVATPIAVL